MLIKCQSYTRHACIKMQKALILYQYHMPCCNGSFKKIKSITVIIIYCQHIVSFIYDTCRAEIEIAGSIVIITFFIATWALIDRARILMITSTTTLLFALIDCYRGAMTLYIWCIIYLRCSLHNIPKIWNEDIHVLARRPLVPQPQGKKLMMRVFDNDLVYLSFILRQPYRNSSPRASKQPVLAHGRTPSLNVIYSYIHYLPLWYFISHFRLIDMMLSGLRLILLSPLSPYQKCKILFPIRVKKVEWLTFVVTLISTDSVAIQK